ncbi:MAG: hypothetical protein COA52_07275 [Hyphomicrobiales bacterium]|nr:MAG: hypothetical protein COA52_07275 [Hyphomicrobiales bacterium]
MSDTQNSSSLDRPLTSIGDDKLYRENFVKQLCNALIVTDNNKATGAVIGLMGEWGSGKSSILNFVEQEILNRSKEAIVFRFDPWLISERDQLVESFLQDFKLAVQKNKGILGRIFFITGYLLTRYQKKLSIGLDILGIVAGWLVSAGILVSNIPFIGSVAKHLIELFKSEDKTLHQLKSQIDKGLVALDFPIVVLIDEVDRLDNTEIVEIMRLVKSVADFPNVSYLIAYDADRVVEALGAQSPSGDAERKGRAYLEKIVQHQILLPALFEDELKQMLRDEVSNVIADEYLQDLTKTDGNYARLERAIFPYLIQTPRDLKRCIGIFRTQYLMVGSEVYWVDVLGYSILLTKAPQVANHVRRDPIFFSDDFEHLGIAYHRYDNNPPSNSKQLAGLLGDDWDKQLERNLILCLFPRFAASESWVNVDSENQTKIRNSRPLAFLMRQGIPPGYYSIEQASVVFNLNKSRMASALKASMNDDKLSDFEYLLSYHYDKLAIRDDVALWVNLVSWISKPDSVPLGEIDPMFHVFRLFDATLITAAKNSKTLKQNYHKIVNSLADRGLDQYVAHLLRNEVFAHGLFEVKARSDYPKLIEEAEARNLCILISKEWKNRHMTSDWFFTNWKETPIWLMNDMGVWDEECRKRLAELIDDRRTFDSFILMVWGADYIINREVLETMLGNKVFADLFRKYGRIDGNSQPNKDVSNARSKILRTFGDIFNL